MTTKIWSRSFRIFKIIENKIKKTSGQNLWLDFKIKLGLNTKIIEVWFHLHITGYFSKLTLRWIDYHLKPTLQKHIMKWHSSGGQNRF